jgi:hypothetical protein
MPEPHVDTSTAVASTYADTVRLGIEGRSVRAGDALVNPRTSKSHAVCSCPRPLRPPATRFLR